MRRRAVVVGAGVTGLTTAVTLVEDGWEVVVRTAQRSSATTSAVAAAVWFPYLVGPRDAVERWGRRSAEVFAELAGDPDVPVAERTLHEWLRTSSDPAWRTGMAGFTGEPADVLPDWVAVGWRYTSWVADMPRYLPWLLERLDDHDVPVGVTQLPTLAEAWEPDTDLVVDAAGVGAARLAEDDELEPVRGQVVLVDAPEVTDVWTAPDGDEGATYVIPRPDSVVLGGTAERGRWDREPDPATTAAIRRRAARLHPAVADAPLLDVAVGLRPSRPTVRLELERTPHGPVLHHYGHGGAGVTLSWGAAEAAAALARTVGDGG